MIVSWLSPPLHGVEVVSSSEVSDATPNLTPDSVPDELQFATAVVLLLGNPMDRIDAIGEDHGRRTQSPQA
jgi:hypothetical protein